jgi:hypothetical protein
MTEDQAWPVGFEAGIAAGIVEAEIMITDTGLACGRTPMNARRLLATSRRSAKRRSRPPKVSSGTAARPEMRGGADPAAPDEHLVAGASDVGRDVGAAWSRKADLDRFPPLRYRQHGRPKVLRHARESARVRLARSRLSQREAPSTGPQWAAANSRESHRHWNSASRKQLFRNRDWHQSRRTGTTL